jgi:predicted porin
LKHTRIAASVIAALAGSVAAAPAAAQSTVSLYGRANVSVESQKVTGVDRTNVVQNNASRWGLRGSEDLGGGLKAFFQLESGFNIDTGVATNNFGQGASGSLFNRESFAGVSGGFGQVRFGRITSPLYFASADYISMHNHDTGTSSDALFAFGATGVNNNNSVAYKTPSFGGMDVEVAYSFAAGFLPNNAAAFVEQPGSNNQTNLQVAFNGQWGAFHLGGGFAQMKDKSGLPAVAEQKDETAVIRGLMELGAFTVGAYYERSKLDFGAGQRRSRNNYRLSGMYALGQNEFHLNYGMAGDFSGLADSGGNQWTVGYNFNLSKRTKVYAFYTQIDDDARANFYVGATPGAKFSSLAAGLRHNF